MNLVPQIGGSDGRSRRGRRVGMRLGVWAVEFGKLVMARAEDGLEYLERYPGRRAGGEEKGEE